MVALLLLLYPSLCSATRHPYSKALGLMVERIAQPAARAWFHEEVLKINSAPPPTLKEPAALLGPDESLFS